MTKPRFFSCCLLFFSILGLTACDGQQEKTEEERTIRFFDLKGYFEKEKERILSLPYLEKTVIHMGKSEVRRIEPDSSQLEADLSAFTKADLNRPDWLDKYQIDSIQDNGGTQLSYSALEKDLRVRRIDIFLDVKGEVKELRVRKKSSSPIADFDQRLKYRPAEGFRIESIQKNAVGGQDSISVDVKWDN
jgi:hypothetical protein